MKNGMFLFLDNINLKNDNYDINQIILNYH